MTDLDRPAHGQTQQQIGKIFAEDLGLAEADALDQAWIRRVLSCFPVPTIAHASHLLMALDRITQGVAWGLELFPADFTEPLGRLAPSARGLQERMPRRYPAAIAKPEGEFLFSGSLGLLDASDLAPRWQERLRLVLLACHWRWAGTAKLHQSAVEALASAIRGGSRTDIPQDLCFRMGRAGTVSEFIDVASELRESKPDQLADAWRLHFDRALRELAQLQAPEQPAGLVQPPLTGPSGASGVDKHDPDEWVERLQAGVRPAAYPLPAGLEGPLPGELPDEVAPPAVVSPLLAAPANPDSRAVLRYQAQQVVWGTNHALIPNHPDVLSLPDYARVVQEMISLLAAPVEDGRLRLGVSALLIQALTGRTARTLTAIEVARDGKAGHTRGRMELLLAEAAFRLTPFWQLKVGEEEPSYFRPDEHQKSHLEQVGSSFILPLAAPFAKALYDHQDCIQLLKEMSIPDIEACLRHAVCTLGEGVGFSFTNGQLRSSFSTHLYELCRDMAATQLICADTLGKSAASLSYYAPRTGDLAGRFWSLQGQLLGKEVAMPERYMSGSRVGAQLLVRKESARAMARAPASRLHHGVDALMGNGQLAEVHQVMVNHLTAMLMAAATHRPGTALLRLTLSDFWWDGDCGAGIFRDKVHDAAHDPRLVALSRTLCRQLQAYLEHLVGLGEHAQGLAAHIDHVLQGKRPLFFGLTDQLGVEELDFSSWRESMPAIWRELPMNWGRHWMRTHAVEHGVPPELVNIQLGHLEIAGYPFSGASPTEPWYFVEVLAPKWEALVQAQGWRVFKGIPATGKLLQRTLPPLRQWEGVVSGHEREQRRMAKLWRTAMVAKMRSYREEAEVVVRQHPVLLEKGIISRFDTKRQNQARHELAREDFERVRDQVYDQAGEDLARAIANANAVCRIAKVVNGRTGQKPENPSQLQIFRRPLDNAFFPGMLQAVRQVHALRAHLSTPSGQSQATWRDMASACASTVLAMMLFGGCDDMEKIIGALHRRVQMERSANLQDLILVPWGDEPHQVLALRGVAAVVFARLAWKRSKDVVPDRADIEAEIATLLPGWALGSGNARVGPVGGLMKKLTDVVSVAGRYELSPAARKVGAVVGGATSAHLREQIALIDGDPAGTLDREWEESGEEGRLAPRVVRTGARKGNARSQYLGLCRLFPSAAKDTQLTMTGETILSGEAASQVSRVKVVEEIKMRLRIEDPAARLQPIVHLLSAWSVDMLVHGTARENAPALATVETYLTRIGGLLVEVFGQSSMEDIDELELEQAYLTCVESKKESRSKAAAAVLSFHRFGQIHHGLPEIDATSIQMYLGDEGRAMADARLVLPVERTQILARLSERAMDGSDAEDSRHVRARRQAAQVFPLFALGGMRRGEALGIQFRDVARAGDCVRVKVRPNRSRRLKTINARRTVEVPANAVDLMGNDLVEWVRIDVSRLKAAKAPRAFVFSDSDAPFSGDARNNVAEACMQVCCEVTGRRNSRLHAFRHLVAMERTTPLFLHDQDRQALGTKLSLSPTPTQRGVPLPRDLQSQIVGIGHADGATTFTHYHHMPWLLRSRLDARLTTKYEDKRLVAHLLGTSVHTQDWATKTHPGRTKLLGWLDVQSNIRQVPASPVQRAQLSGHVEESHGRQARTTWTARDLDRLLAEVDRVGSLEPAMLVLGLPMSEAEQIRLLLDPMERRLGKRLLVETPGSGPVAPGRHRRVRDLKQAGILEAILGEYDRQDDPGKRIASLAESAFEHLEPRQGDRIVLPRVEAGQLRDLMIGLGVAEDQILVEASGPRHHVLRISRSAADKQPKPANRYLGLALKRLFLIIRLTERLRAAPYE